MTIGISKKLIFSLIVVLWVIFSAIYIAKDVWDDFKANQLAQTYQQAKLETINTLITQTETGCQAISVSNGSKTIQVINAACQTTK
jgi:hypothetical protein